MKGIEPGYVIEFGRYYYDNKPLIGKLADINMWDRVLEKEEMEKFSGCHDIVEGNGNVINKDFNFNITGKLVTNLEIPDTEISCKKMWSFLYLPIHMPSLESASDVCNKLEINSIGPKIDKPEDYIDFYKGIHKFPAYKTHCWHGSRMLTFIPYIQEPKNPGPGHGPWKHLIDGTKLGIEAWTSWNKNETTKRQCIQAYMGPAQTMNHSLAIRKCGGSSYAWAPCFACNLIHSHDHNVVLKLTGLCDRTAFDKYYHIKNDEEGYVILYGFTGTIIQYDGENKRWNIHVY